MSAINGRDAGGLKKYRTEIPNIVFTLGLDPYALALYCHLKRTAGAADGGLCYKSTRTLAEETGMSIGKVSEARSELEQPRAELGGKPLIHVERPQERGKAVEVVCMDVWLENFQHFGPEGSCSSGERRVHHTNTDCSSGEHKKEPLKKEPQKNPPPSYAGPPKGERPAKKPKTLNGEDVVDYAAHYEEFIERDPLGPKLARLLKLAASENKSKRMRFSRAVSEFIEPIRMLREDGYTNAQLAHGISEAVKNRAPHINYVKKAARNQEPVEEPVQAPLDENPYDLAAYLESKKREAS